MTLSHAAGFTSKKPNTSGYSTLDSKFTCAILFLALTKIKMSLWPVETLDTRVYFLPWLDFIHTHGHWFALKYPIGQYFPIYLYLLAATSYLEKFISPLGQIKLIPLVFDLFASIMAYRITKQLESEDGVDLPTSIRPTIAFFAVFALPSLLIDGALWGQCDSILVSFLLATVFYLLRQSPVRAAICFGLALSFKIQAIFLGPFLLALLLRRRLRIWHALVVPVVWFLSVVPILLLGRDLHSVLDIFSVQSQEYNTLAMNVANPWCLYARFHHGYPVGLALGLVLTSLATGALTYVGYRHKELGGTWIFLFATTTLIVMPYVMPKMHDRYFLAGQVFLVILVCHHSRFLLPAALLECALILPYINFLALPDWDVHSLEVGLCASTAAIYLLGKTLLVSKSTTQDFTQAFASPPQSQESESAQSSTR